MIQYTDAQKEAAIRLVNRYVNGRDARVNRVKTRQDQMEFMRFCNEMAREFESVSPEMSFGELAAMFVAFNNTMNGTPTWGVDFSQWSELTPWQIVGTTELLGCALGIRRMESGR
jgi:hypothetical protein